MKYDGDSFPSKNARTHSFIRNKNPIDPILFACYQNTNDEDKIKRKKKWKNNNIKRRLYNIKYIQWIYINKHKRSNRR